MNVRRESESGVSGRDTACVDGNVDVDNVDDGVAAAGAVVAGIVGFGF